MEPRMNRMLRFVGIIALTIVTGVFQAKAQKTLISDPDEVIRAAADVMGTAMKEGLLAELKKKHNLTGAYIIDVTIRGKGEVASVFVADREGGSIEFQNLIKDHIKAMRMNFRMPQNKDYKFRYKFDFGT